MHGLKILVGFMTLLIVFGLLALGYGFATKFGGNSLETPLSLPQNAAIQDMAAGDGFIALHVTSGRERHIYIVGSRDGKVRNRIKIERQK